MARAASMVALDDPSRLLARGLGMDISVHMGAVQAISVVGATMKSEHMGDGTFDSHIWNHMNTQGCAMVMMCT
jgi:hypothetical protein